MGSYLAIGEFPLRIVPTKDGGEGIRRVFTVCENIGTHGSVCDAGKPLYTLKSREKNPLYEHSENSTKNQEIKQNNFLL